MATPDVRSRTSKKKKRTPHYRGYTNLRTWPENNGSDIDARREYADDRKQLDEMVMSGETGGWG